MHNESDSYSCYLKNGDVWISFPYNQELIDFIKQNIPGRIWNSRQRVWQCPLTSLPEVMDLLEPKGFQIPDKLKARRQEAEAKRAEKDRKIAPEKEANERLKQLMDAGEEIVFIPSVNKKLTQELKARKAYEIVKEKNYRNYHQVIGVLVPESELLEVFTKLELPSDPASRLCELLRYTWHVNSEAKARESSSRRYRHSKKNHLLNELCRLANKQSVYKWGWKKNPNPPIGFEWVIYFERDSIQSSFHQQKRGEGPDFDGDRDEIKHEKFPFEKYLSEGKRILPIREGV